MVLKLGIVTSILASQNNLMIDKLDKQGFCIVENIYSPEEVTAIISLIESEAYENTFGLREFLLDKRELTKLVFNSKLLAIIRLISPNCNKLIKSIYFDKPPNANWIVNWHQDLTINLLNKKEVEGYKNWRVTDKRVVVQPRKEFLENIFTIRIHLDDCTIDNGALRVIKNSHTEGVIDIKKWLQEKRGIEQICEVKKGGALIMKPLILHSSRRAENSKNRRVIHIEFTDEELPEGLQWKEMIEIDKIFCV